MLFPTTPTSLINTRGLIGSASLNNHHKNRHNNGSHKWPKTYCVVYDANHKTSNLFMNAFTVNNFTTFCTQHIHSHWDSERKTSLFNLILERKQQRHMSRKGHHNNVINLSLQEKREREIVIESWWMQYEFTSYLFSIDTEHFNHTCKHCSNDILKWKTEKRSLSSCFPERTKQTHTQRISTNNGQLIQ